MLKSYIYLFLEMLLIILVINTINTAEKHAPGKIKALVKVLLILGILRFTSNIILFISGNIIFLYILKFFALINIVTIPISALLCFYIFYRDDKIKFDYIIMVCTLLFLTYSIAVFNMKYYIKRTIYFGYIISFENWTYVDFVFILLLSVVLLAALMIFGKKSSNNFGFTLLIAAAAIAIIEVVLKIFGIQFMPNFLITDILWMLVVVYALNTFKLKKSR